MPELERIIAERKAEMPEGSYVAGLLSQGLDRILKKIAEEAGEVIIAAKNEGRDELIYECETCFSICLYFWRPKI